MLASGMAVDNTDALMQVALPESAEAEAGTLEIVEHLTTAVTSGCAGFYKMFGWGSADEYFREQGLCQAMLVDLDHNDLDDRLAIVLLAFQMASANLDRKTSGEDEMSPKEEKRCMLLLDGRTYEKEAGSPTIWRILRLSFRLNSILGGCGLKIVPVLSDRMSALELCASYVGVPANLEALDTRVAGISMMLQDDTDMLRSSLQGVWAEGDVASLWIMSGLCAAQVQDVELLLATPALKLSLFEQSQPAWHSMEVDPKAEVQPAWELAPGEPLPDSGYAVEPSNVRSSGDPYPQTLYTYMRFQHAVATADPSRTNYVVSALARKAGVLPAPPGQQMLRVGGRLLQVCPGAEYVVKGSGDKPRAEAAFAGLLAASSRNHSETLYPELCQGVLDESGNVRVGIEHVARYGTNMPDAILVALAARPREILKARPVVRRLAVISDESGEHPPWPAVPTPASCVAL